MQKSLIRMHNYFSKMGTTSKAEVILPERIERGSIENYKYLFYNCMLNYGMKSSVLYENLMKLYQSNPLLFSPEYICNTYAGNYGALADILRSFVHVRYHNQCAKTGFLYLKLYIRNIMIIPKSYLLERIHITIVRLSFSNLKDTVRKRGIVITDVNR